MYSGTKERHFLSPKLAGYFLYNPFLILTASYRFRQAKKKKGFELGQ